MSPSSRYAKKGFRAPVLPAPPCRAWFAIYWWAGSSKTLDRRPSSLRAPGGNGAGVACMPWVYWKHKSPAHTRAWWAREEAQDGQRAGPGGCAPWPRLNQQTSSPQRLPPHGLADWKPWGHEQVTAFFSIAPSSAVEGPQRALRNTFITISAGGGYRSRGNKVWTRLPAYFRCPAPPDGYDNGGAVFQTDVSGSL